MQKLSIHTFDFDGTLTTADTMIELIRFARGTTSLLTGLACLSPFIILMKLGLYPNWRAKERLLTWFFGGTSEGRELTDFLAAANISAIDFALARQDLIRPQAIAMIRTLNAHGQPTIIVSASAENWVTKMAEQAFGKDTTVTGTRLEVSNGKITGRIDGANCYGAEKTRRIREYLESHNISREQCYITAYGDSRGDKEMTDYADKSHYKPFGD